MRMHQEENSNHPCDRIVRAQLYAQWIRDDADGLLYQLRGPSIPEEDRILKEARTNVKAALDLIEHRLSQMEIV